MKYKTSAEIKDGALVLKDDALKDIGDIIFAYHALLQAIEKHDLKVNVDFTIRGIGSGPLDERHEVIFCKEVTPAVIQTLEKAYPGLVVHGKEAALENNKQIFEY